MSDIKFFDGLPSRLKRLGEGVF